MSLFTVRSVLYKSSFCGFQPGSPSFQPHNPLHSCVADFHVVRIVFRTSITLPNVYQGLRKLSELLVAQLALHQ